MACQDRLRGKRPWMMAAVTGAIGFTGKRVVAELLRRVTT